MLSTISDYAHTHPTLRRKIRRTIWPISVLLLSLVVASLFMLRWFEKAVTFHPERYNGGASWKLPAGGEDVWFRGASGERLHGWFVRTPGPAAATIIYFHGNGGNLSYVGWLAERLTARGFDVLLFDYRGYGRSEGAVTDEQGLYADADAAYEYLTRERGVRPEQLVLYGQSLGTTAAVDLASRRPCAALILESGLSSASDMASVVLPWLPKRLHRFGRNRFDSARKLSASVRCPVLVIHGALDSIIPVEQAYTLYNAAHEPKRLIIIPDADHNNVAGSGGEDYWNTLTNFVHDAVRPHR